MYDFNEMSRKELIEHFEGVELISVLESQEHGLFLCYWMDLALPDWKTISDYQEINCDEHFSQNSADFDVYLYVPLTQEVYELMSASEMDIRTGMLSYNGGQGYYQVGNGDIELAKILETTPKSVPDAGVFLNE